MNKIAPKNKICFALDVDTEKEALYFVKLLSDYVGLFKVGMQLFTQTGPKLVEKIVSMGGQVFLDLKYHDIPNTVAHAARAAVSLGVSIFDIHASGGSYMMQKTVEAARSEADKSGLPPPKILAITVLTSLNETMLQKELHVDLPLKAQVKALAQLAKDSGADGAVCSPQEIGLIKDECGADFMALTPGIRPAWSVVTDDQQRIMTPAKAVSEGADIIVIGRPIRCAADPKQAAEKILAEISARQEM